METGLADDYLKAHAEWAPVSAPASDMPRYDVILDAEASNELFQEFSNGKFSLQDASQEQLQSFLGELTGQHCSCEHVSENPWKALVIKAVLTITGLVVFIFAVVLLTR